MDRPTPLAAVDEPVSAEGEDIIPIRVEKAYFTATIVPEDAALMEVCPVCKYTVSKACVECRKSVPRGTCSMAKGACGHFFHSHCVDQWLHTGNQKCPQCGAWWREPADRQPVD